MACPTKSDLSDGVSLEWANGAVTTFVRSPSGGVLQRSRNPEGRLTAERETVGELFDTRSVRYLAEGDVAWDVTFSYSFDPIELGPIKAGKLVSGRRFETTAHGGNFSDRLVVRVLSRFELSIGGCEYTAVPFLYVFGPFWDREEIEATYFPELGVMLEVDYRLPMSQANLLNSSISVSGNG